ANLVQEIDQIHAAFASSQRKPILIEVVADLSVENPGGLDAIFQTRFRSLLHLYAMANGRFVMGVDGLFNLPSGFLMELVERLLRNPDAPLICFDGCLDEKNDNMEASVSHSHYNKDDNGMVKSFSQRLNPLSLWLEKTHEPSTSIPADHRMCWSKKQLFQNAESWPTLEDESLNKSACSLSKLFQIHFSSAYQALEHTVMLHLL
ncbi:MAG: hypothetical protein K2X66_12815, partial [Cyanobacteria bacterium]|nr:hypothetical protein [Cyanobacteriota bacterium]